MSTPTRLRLAAAGVCALLSSMAQAQMDFSGEWPVVLSQDNSDNPHLGEYVGIPLSREAILQVVHDVKYAGYVSRQEQQVARQRRLAEKRIPESFNFAGIRHLRIEAREKLTRIRPVTLDKNDTGKNTITSEMVVASTAGPISRVPSIDAWTGSIPFSSMQ